MNEIIPISDAIEQPEPPAKRSTRKQRKESAQRAAGELNLIRCSVETLHRISQMGEFLNDLGGDNMSRGTAVKALESSMSLMADVDRRLKRLDDLEAHDGPLTPEQEENRIQLMRVKGDTIGYLRALSAEFKKAKPDKEIKVTETKSVKSFPANAAIPAIEITQTHVVKESLGE